MNCESNVFCGYGSKMFLINWYEVVLSLDIVLFVNIEIFFVNK